MPENEDQEINIFLCRRSAARCRYCDRAHTRLCDYPVGGVKETCDVPMCDFCTYKAGRNRDLCKDHRPSGQTNPRRDVNAPRWMKALFRGFCKLCGKTVWTGEKMLWFKTGKKVYCEP